MLQAVAESLAQVATAMQASKLKRQRNAFNLLSNAADIFKAMAQRLVMAFKAQGELAIDFAVIGLGNPGAQYERTRHNVGFMVVDELAKRFNVRLRRRKCKSLLAVAEADGIRLLLAKPLTFMNLSGEAVRQIVSNFKLPLERFIIVLDDSNLPLGKLRIRLSGSHGGHKGLKSVIEALGTDKFPRLRIGIGTPPQDVDMVNFVLSPFEPHEWETITEAIGRAADAAIACATEGLERAMSKFNA